MSKWSDKEIEMLKLKYSENIRVDIISKELNKSTAAIRNKAYKLGITKPNYLTNSDIEYIKTNYKSHNLSDIAKTLRRTKPYLYRIAKQLGIERTGFKKEITNNPRIKKIRREKPLTKEEISKLNSSKMKKWYAEHPEAKKKFGEKMEAWHKNNAHPRGMLGKTHTEKVRQKMSKRMKEAWDDKTSVFNSEEMKQERSDLLVKRRKANDSTLRNRYSRGKQGKRKDLNNLYVRSSWEANYARYLNYLIKNGEIFKWQYEKDTYYFEKIKRGVRSYTPDFKIWEKENSEPYYVEVKGWMDSKSKTKLKRMAKYYPAIKIVLFQSADYKELKKQFSNLIDGWET